MHLILASSSTTRQKQLKRLHLPFEISEPNIDETPLPNEPASTLVQRLAQQKAYAVAPKFQDALIISADQVAVINDTILGKPHTADAAIQQLTDASGQVMTYHCGMSLLHTKTNEMKTTLTRFNVSFRSLTKEEIERYVEKARPFSCAGSLQIEGLGISLVEHLEGEDINALLGLPLMQLCQWLREFDYPLP